MWVCVVSLVMVSLFTVAAMCCWQSQASNSKWEVPEIHFLFLFAFFVSESISCSPGWLQIHYVAGDDLKLPILLGFQAYVLPQSVHGFTCLN